MTSQGAPVLQRSRAVPALVGRHEDFLIVSGLAGPGKDMGDITKEAGNAFLFGGAMGGALSTAFGLALAQPERRILCVTGDGDLLMSLGMLATIGAMQTNNIAVVCVDNALYQETGGQASHTAMGVDLAAIAEGAGFPVVRKVEREEQIAEASAVLRQSNGPVFVQLRVDASPPPAYNRSWHAADAKTAFRRALLGRR
ncbi:MAG: hypothetical protein RLZ98_2858 [Pseudomonadota bacterium]|jgi:phosphonopyruvate decarboxylase